MLFDTATIVLTGKEREREREREDNLECIQIMEQKIQSKQRKRKADFSGEYLHT